MTRHTEVEHNQLLQEQCGLLAYTASLVGDPQVRHRGTIGGSVSHGDAASDLPSALLALEGTFVVKGSGGERTVSAGASFSKHPPTRPAPASGRTAGRGPPHRQSGGEYPHKHQKHAP